MFIGMEVSQLEVLWEYKGLLVHVSVVDHGRYLELEVVQQEVVTLVLRETLLVLSHLRLLYIESVCLLHCQ